VQGQNLGIAITSGKSAVERHSRQRPGAIDALTKPDDLHSAIDFCELIPIDVGDE
jgi:hypothetical protein